VSLESLKMIKDVEILSMRKTQDRDEHIVLVSMTTGRGQETKVLTALKQLENGSPGLKRSKSWEMKSNQSLFHSSPELKSPPIDLHIRRAHTPQERKPDWPVKSPNNRLVPLHVSRVKGHSSKSPFKNSPLGTSNEKAKPNIKVLITSTSPKKKVQPAVEKENVPPII